MTHYILLIISTALINNFVLVKFLGLCPFMGVSKKIETAIGMGLATTFVLTVASLCSYLVDNYILYKRRIIPVYCIENNKKFGVVRSVFPLFFYLFIGSTWLCWK